MHVSQTKVKVAAIVGTALTVVTGTGTAAGATAQPAAATSSPWSQTNYNAAQSRANLAEQILTRATAGKIRHMREVTAPPNPVAGCLGFSSPGVVAPVLVGGSLYAITSGYLTRYNAATGGIIWRRNPDPSFSTVYTSLAVAGGLVVVGEVDCVSVSDPNGTIQAFSAATGARVWSQPISPDGGALAQLVVSKGFVVATGASAAVGQPVSVHKLATGGLVWFRLTGPCTAADVLVDAQVVVAYSCTTAGAERLVGSNLATGARLWSRSGNWRLQRGDTDTTAGRHVFATSPGGAVVSLSPLTGQTQYSLAQARDVFAVDGAQAYASCGTAVCAYGTATGGLHWRAPGFIAAMAAEAGGVLYTDQGLALDTSNGKILTALWQGTAAWLAVGGGRIAAVTDPRIVDLYGLPGS